ncbi:MAG: hypothetical protein KUG69_00205 [Marinosulfonomonas sp.]|nr:hypothetical protein [Marinosulfonomonas sp.]
MRKYKGILVIFGLVLAYFMFFGSSKVQTADLGQVLDRTDFALKSYQEHATEQGFAEIGDEQMAEFTEFYTAVLNSDPQFYDGTLGLTVQEDASFLGFADANANGIQDEKEGKVFTVEVDSENERLIATDVSGNSTGLRLSGSGFLTGMLIGNLISRQGRAGVRPGSFNSRAVGSRTSYKAPSSARSSSRSGGVRAGK